MNKWLQIDAEQNEEWLRKQGTGTYIDLSTIKKGDLPGQVILEKHNGYKEVLNKAALDKSKESKLERGELDGKRISLPDTKRSGGNREKPCEESKSIGGRRILFIWDTGKPRKI